MKLCQSSKSIDNLKPIVLDIRNIYSSCWLGKSKRLPNNTEYWHHPWLPPRTWKQGPLAENTTHFRETWKIQTGTDLEASSLQTCSRRIWRYYTSFQEEKQSIVLPSWKTHEPQQWPTQQDIHNGAIVTLLSWS